MTGGHPKVCGLDDDPEASLGTLEVRQSLEFSQEQELLVVAVASQVGPHVCDGVDEGVDPAAERVDPAGQSIEAGVHSGAQGLYGAQELGVAAQGHVSFSNASFSMPHRAGLMWVS